MMLRKQKPGEDQFAVTESGKLNVTRRKALPFEEGGRDVGRPISSCRENGRLAVKTCGKRKGDNARETGRGQGPLRLETKYL